MGLSSMPSEKLRNNIIAARDRRQELLERRLSGGYPATVFVSLNIPGKDKNPPEATGIFAWALTELLKEFPDAENLVRSSDSLGPYAVISLNCDAVGVKRRCIALEGACPFARLADFDVFNGDSLQIDRAALDFSPRPCLVCDQAAVDCIRLRRHEAEEVLRKTDALLALFRT
jgi:holo-ACP synthase